MTKTTKTTAVSVNDQPSTKHQRVVNLMDRAGGATLEEMAGTANWLPHSTRAFLTGLRKKGYVVESDKTDGVRRYRIIAMPAKA